MLDTSLWLAGLSTKEIQRDRMAAAVHYATAHQVTLVLKGAWTIIVAPVELLMRII
ncbi:hypothetical protein [Paenibacillus dokdonensis]|uniref:hypothetical protein n=1 Tax=Paenibacillus dokdonensis TaxID=2567944 RepID=UPI001457C10B|nr:hypothetical protein [Paenibacillus dokdonensis]